MSRLNRSAENNLEATYQTLRTTVDDLKQAQTFGSSTVRTYRIFNQSSTVDISLYNLSTTVPQCVEVTLTPNTLASNPVIAFDFAFQGTSSTFNDYFFNILPLPPVAGVQKFRVWVTSIGSVSPQFDMAFTFWTISPATFSCLSVAP